MDFKDYYKILGLEKKASAADIKRAYRKLARKHHPDLNPGDKVAEAKFKEINEANEVLGDPDKRSKYDELGANWRAYEQQGAGGPGGWPPRGSGRGGPAYRTVTPDEAQEMFGGEDPFSDFFHAFFGGGGGAGFGQAGAGRASEPRRGRRGHDVEHPVDLTLEEAFTGTSRRLRLSQEGAQDERTVEVRIPAGVTDGARVRAAGEGGAAGAGGARGDLFLRIRLLPHTRFERRGQDLHVRVPVPVTTAVLGGEVSVTGLGGSTLRLKIPALTTGGRVFRLRGHGMPAVGKPDERGDLYATVDLQIPAQVSDEAREHYEALKRIADGGTGST
jgi:DnaJ-class molecular chaperone